MGTEISAVNYVINKELQGEEDRQTTRSDRKGGHGERIVRLDRNVSRWVTAPNVSRDRLYVYSPRMHWCHAYI